MIVLRYDYDIHIYPGEDSFKSRFQGFFQEFLLIFSLGVLGGPLEDISLDLNQTQTDSDSVSHNDGVSMALFINYADSFWPIRVYIAY